jgi:hypothetical protein
MNVFAERALADFLDENCRATITFARGHMLCNLKLSVHRASTIHHGVDQFLTAPSKSTHLPKAYVRM